MPKIPKKHIAGVRLTKEQLVYLFCAVGINTENLSFKNYLQSYYNADQAFDASCKHCDQVIIEMNAAKAIRCIGKDRGKIERCICAYCSPKGKINQLAIIGTLSLALGVEFKQDSRPLQIKKADYPEYFRRWCPTRETIKLEIDGLQVRRGNLNDKRLLAIEIDGASHNPKRGPQSPYDEKRTKDADDIKDIEVLKKLQDYDFIRIPIVDEESITNNLERARQILRRHNVLISKEQWELAISKLPPIKSPYRENVIKNVQLSGATWEEGQPPSVISRGTRLKLICEQGETWDGNAESFARTVTGCSCYKCANKSPTPYLRAEKMAEDLGGILSTEKESLRSSDYLDLNCITCSCEIRPRNNSDKNYQMRYIRKLHLDHENESLYCPDCNVINKIPVVKAYLRLRGARGEGNSAEAVGAIQKKYNTNPLDSLKALRQGKSKNIHSSNVIKRLNEAGLDSELELTLNKLGSNKTDSEKLEQLRCAKKQPGGMINTNHTEPCIQSIVRHFKKQYKEGALNKETEKTLNDCGVIFKSTKKSRPERLAEFSDFVDSTGKLPRCADNSGLYDWVNRNSHLVKKKGILGIFEKEFITIYSKVKPI